MILQKTEIKIWTTVQRVEPLKKGETMGQKSHKPQRRILEKEELIHKEIMHQDNKTGGNAGR